MMWNPEYAEHIEGSWVWKDMLGHTEIPVTGYTNWYPG